MNTYRIAVEEVTMLFYSVEANTEEEAIAILESGSPSDLELVDRDYLDWHITDIYKTLEN